MAENDDTRDLGRPGGGGPEDDGLSHPEKYTREEAEEAMQMISEAGFNLVMDYNMYGKDFTCDILE